MDEDTIYRLLDRMIVHPVPRKEIESKGMGDWSAGEVGGLLNALLTAGLISENSGGMLEITGKGKFFWKRVRRKKQGFV